MPRLTNIFEENSAAQFIGLGWGCSVAANQKLEGISRLEMLVGACAEAGITDAAAIADIAIEGIQVSKRLSQKQLKEEN